MSSAPNARIDLNLLAFFLAVADEGSFSIAARRLGLTGSSVSRGIASLESSLGVQLFARTTRQVALTRVGAKLHARVAPTLASLTESLDSAAEQDERNPSGEIRVTAPADIAAFFLPNALASFSARYPDVRLDVRITSEMVDLVAGGVDVALRASGVQLKNSSLVATRLHGFEWSVFAAPSYLGRAGAPNSTSDAANHEWVVLRGSKVRVPITSKQKPRIVADEILFLREAVIAGLGLGFLPRFLAREPIAMGKLVRVLPSVAIRSGGIYLVSPQLRHVPARLTVFRQHLSAFFGTSLAP